MVKLNQKHRSANVFIGAIVRFRFFENACNYLHIFVKNLCLVGPAQTLSCTGSRHVRGQLQAKWNQPIASSRLALRQFRSSWGNQLSQGEPFDGTRSSIASGLSRTGTSADLSALLATVEHYRAPAFPATRCCWRSKCREYTLNPRKIVISEEIVIWCCGCYVARNICVQIEQEKRQNVANWRTGTKPHGCQRWNRRAGTKSHGRQGWNRRAGPPAAGENRR